MGQRIWFYVLTGCVAIVEISVGILISPSVAIWMLIISLPLGLFSFWKLYKPSVEISLKKGSNKMLILLGIFLVVGGLVGGGILIKSQLDINSNATQTIVYCCTRNNTYQVWAVNKGNKTDTIFITLGVSSLITDFQANMGAKLPTVIEGGKNGNFITFEIEQLPPKVNLTYLIDVHDKAEQAYKFTAWSEIITSDIEAKFTGQCPSISKVGPEETMPY